jgi:hypothetical protein
MNISIQSTYYPENPPKDLNDLMEHIARQREEVRNSQLEYVRLDEHRANELAKALETAYGRYRTNTDQGFNRN